MRNWIVASCGFALLTGCGGSGVQTPEQLRGIWAADCATPFVRIEASKIHVYPDDVTYDLKSATLQGSSFQVGYDSPQGAITETYVVEGATLRLDKGLYGGQEATWHKAPMNKCG